MEELLPSDIREGVGADPDDLTLLGGDEGGLRMGMIGVLTLLERPERAATHTLTVTLTSSDGERYSARVTVTLG